MSLGSLGRLGIEIYADTASFSGDLGRIKNETKAWADSQAKQFDAIKYSLAGVAAAAAAYGASLVSMGKDIIATTAALDDMAEKTGASVEKLSGFATVAKVSGQDLGTLEAGMAKLAKGIVSAGEETKGAGAALKFLGINARDAAGNLKDTATLTEEIAKALTGYADGTGKAALAQDLFGKSGAQLLPFLKDLATAGQLVTKVTAAQASAAEEYEKTLKRLAIAKEDLVRTVTLELVPVLQVLANMYLSTKTSTDSTLAAAQKLAGDGSIRDWAEKAAYAGALVVDSFSSVKTTLFVVGEAIAGTVRANLALTDAMAGAASGNIPKVAEAAARMVAIQKDMREQIDGILQGHKSVRFELEAQLAKQREIDRLVAKYADDKYKDARDLRGAKGADYKGSESGIKVAKESAEAYLAVLDKIFAKESGLEASFNKDLQTLYDAYKRNKLGADEYVRAVDALIRQQPFVKRGAEEQNKAFDEAFEVMEKQRLAVENSIKSARLMVEGMEFELSIMGLSNTEREIAIRLREIERGGIEKGSAAYEMFAKRIRAAAEGGEEFRKQQEAVRDSTKAWDDFATAGGRFFSDLVMNGRSAFDRLKDSLKSFAAELIALFAKRWILNMVAGMTGSTSLAAAASTAGNGTMAGSLLNLLPAGFGQAAMVGLASAGIGYGLAKAMGAGDRGQKIAGITGFLGGGLVGAIIGKLADPKGPAMRSAWVGTDNKGDAGGFRWSSPFGDGGIFASKWFNAQYDEQIRKFAGGIGQFDTQIAKFLTPEQIARVTGNLAGSKQYDFGMQNTDPAAYLGTIFKDRLGVIFDAIDPKLKALIDGFQGTAEELGTFAMQLLELKKTLDATKIGGLNFDNLQKMQVEGENLGQTLARVTHGFAAIQAVSDQQTDTLAAYAKALDDMFGTIGMSVPANVEAWKALAATIDLSTESGRALFDVMAQGAATFQQVQQAVQSSIAGIWASAQSIYGGQFGATFAKAKLQATYAQWQQMRGENFSFEQMLDAFKFYGQNPGALSEGIDATRQQYGATGVALLNQLFADYSSYVQAMGQASQGVTSSFTGVSSSVNEFAQRLSEVRDGLASYLRGLNQSDLSPLSPTEKYAEARRVFMEQLGLAQGGNLDAMAGIQGYHQAFLNASRGIFASSGQYNTDYFSSYNQLAALTGGQVGPLTGAQFSAGNAALVQEVQAMRAEATDGDSRIVDAVVALAGVVIEKAETGDVTLQAKIDALTLALQRLGKVGVS